MSRYIETDSWDSDKTDTEERLTRIQDRVNQERLREVPKVKAKEQENKVSGNEIELKSKMDANLRGAELYLKGAGGAAPKRTLAFDDTEDPFHLLGVTDTFEVAVSDIFNACEVFFSKKIKGDRALQKDHKLTGTVTLTQKKNTIYSFALRRIADGDQVMFSFGRADDKSNETGFEIVKGAAGKVILKSRGDTAVDDNDAYFDLIVRAKNAIDDFLSSYGMIAEQLAAMTPDPIPVYHAVQVPEGAKKVWKRGRSSSWNYFHPETKVKTFDQYGDLLNSKTGPRNFSKRRALAIPVLLASLYGGVTIADNFIVNNSERSREVFDHSNPVLASAPSISIDGEKHKFQLVSVSPAISEWTPRIELTSDMQNLRGIRSITSGDAGAEIALGENSCDSAYVDLGGKTRVKAVTNSEQVAENLNVSLSNDDGKTKLEVCSTGDYGSTENHVWVEAV